MAVDEEFLRPGREHIAYIDAQIKKSEIDTLEKIEKFRGDEAYERELWRRHYASIEPMRRERDAVAKVMADYYGLQPMPTVIIPVPGQHTRDQ